MRGTMGGPGRYDLACARADLVVMVVGRVVVESLRLRLSGYAAAGASSESSSEPWYESSSTSSGSETSRQSACCQLGCLMN